MGSTSVSRFTTGANRGGRIGREAKFDTPRDSSSFVVPRSDEFPHLYSRRDAYQRICLHPQSLQAYAQNDEGDGE